MKKEIAKELAQAETKIAATHRGPALLATCKVQDMKVDEKNWEHRIESAVEVRKEFEDLFGSDEKKAKKLKKEKKRKKEKEEGAKEKRKHKSSKT